MNKVNASTIKSHTVGQCRGIVLTLAPHLAPIIERGNRHGPCICGGTDRARCHNDFNETGGIFCNQCGGGSDVFAVLMWANNWTFQEALDAVCSFIGLSDKASPPLLRIVKPVRVNESKDWSRERQRLMAIWEETGPDDGLIARYLQSRGITIPVPPSLRLHPALEYFENGKVVAKYPAMVCAVTLNDQMIGLHMTFLDHDGSGKAPVSSPRKIRKCAASINGGAIQLYDSIPDMPLTLAEGIETALATFEMGRLPVWSCMNTSLMKAIQLPGSVRDARIAVDLDRSGAGLKAATELGERLMVEGREVFHAIPPGPIPDGQKSLDWNDVLMQEAANVK